jgi:hypothetical protein
MEHTALLRVGGESDRECRADSAANRRSDNEIARMLPCVELGIPLLASAGCDLCSGRVAADAYSDTCWILENLSAKTGEPFCQTAIHLGSRVIDFLAIRPSNR